MKTTPFTEKHISLGAKMHEFAGYNMPLFLILISEPTRRTPISYAVLCLKKKKSVTNAYFPLPISVG